MADLALTNIPNSGPSLAGLRYWPLVLMGILVSLLSVLLSWSTIGSFDQAIIEALIRLTIVIGLYVFIGNTGIISFGHIGFVVIGAYATAWLTCCYETRAVYMPGLPAFILAQDANVFVAVACGGLLSGAVALLTGFALMRLTGIAASIGTFAFFIVVHSVYLHWDAWTAGPRAVIGIPTVTTVCTALVAALLAMAAAFFYARSRSGMFARAARDDQVAALSSGVEVFRHRLIAFVLSAVMAGTAGGLMAEFLGMITVSSFYLDMVFVTLSMLVVGGMQSLSGAVVGTTAISFLIEILRRMESDVTVYGFNLPTNSAEVGLGLIVLLTLAFRPDGLCRNREIYWPFGHWAAEAPTSAQRRQS